MKAELKDQEQEASTPERGESIEAVFNKHSWNTLGAISPSKDFCLLAMKEWAEIENERLSYALEFNVQTNINLMKKLVELSKSTPTPNTGSMSLQECKDEVAKSYGYVDWDELYKNEDNNNSVINQVAELYAQQSRQPLNQWNNARNEAPVLTDDYLEIEVLADTGDYNNNEVVLFDGTDYFDKHRNDDDGNPIEITDKIVRWKYI